MSFLQLRWACQAKLAAICAVLLAGGALAQEPSPTLPSPPAPVTAIEVPAPPASAASASTEAATPLAPSTTPADPAPVAPAASAVAQPLVVPLAPPATPAPPSDRKDELPALVGTEVAPAADQIVDAPSLHTDLWGRLRQSYAMPTLDSDLVRKWEQHYSSRPDYLQRMFERGGRYLYHIVDEVNRRQMPAELALLPFVESAFNPNAVSSARASGMWQFMPATGRSFDLRQNVFRDDRRSVLDSTRAALDYLKQLHEQFGDWQLALAAYNWGQGNVAKAVSNSRRQGRSGRYDELAMPDETRNYVPKLQAIANLVARPESLGVNLPPLENHPYFLTVRVDRDIDVAVAAKLAGLALAEFQALNPQMNKPVILAAGTPQLLLPFDNAQRYQREVRQHRGAFASWTAWVAPATLNPAEVARRVGMSEAQLREVNHIPARMLVKAGSTLLVPRPSAAHDVSERVADTASISLAPEPLPGRRVLVKVGPKGESVADVAQRYRLAAAQLASWNSVPAKGSFKPGQQVVMYTTAAPLAPSFKAGRAVHASTPAKAAGKASHRQGKPAPAARSPVRVASRAAPGTVKR